jgi:hypothetical protein
VGTPGTEPTAYVRALSARLGAGYGVSINQSGGAAIAITLAGTLTLLLSIAAGLGVLNTVVLHIPARCCRRGGPHGRGRPPRSEPSSRVAAYSRLS